MATSVAQGNVIELRQGQKPLGGVVLANFTLDHNTPDARIVYADTNPAGWNTGAGRMTFEAQFVCNSYFAANPIGHFAIVLRQDPALVATAVRGQGVASGNATGFGDSSDLNPTLLLETWFNGTGAGNYCYPNSETARSRKMQDGLTYRIMIDSTKCNDGDRYLRYRLYTPDLVNGHWIQLVDTGDVLDHNVWADLTKSALMIGQVFESNLVTWSIDFTNAKVTWGPAENATPDQTSKLSRYGAQLDGNLTFTSSARRVAAPFTGGPSLVNALQFVSSTANTATSMAMLPNGSATTSNWLWSNHSSSTTTYQALTAGMTGAVALLETFGYSAADPSLGINIGAANRVATYKVTGLNILGGSKDIGQVIGYSAGLTNWGGANAASLSTTATLDMENFCTPLFIKNFLISVGLPAVDADGIEQVTRPLYSLFSFLIKNLQDKKVI